MLARLVVTFSLLLAAACGKQCKDACAKLSSCSLKSSGFSCNQCKTDGDVKCSDCIDATSCADLQGGKCQGTCGGAVFSK